MKWTGTKWEYKSANLDEYRLSEVEVQVLFGDLGNQGWELVTIVHADRHSTAFFRRPIASKPETDKEFKP